MGHYYDQVKINMSFLNRNHYFLLHILVAEVESFSILYKII